ncbi:energy transducer TonB [Stenotrophomonas indicatrix]|uniref:Outer membrane transport energization protein TonB n=1 Tax=Stenotrophomonas indicatrix TaxID=2045451 RepID=A0A1W1GU56_9GAMM|nr:energy transducer TonB [Stenotrophomonas indicatrix]SLM22896.1 outer membrane transport energization protein TonB [Stenotrophomonas indicatrix]
MSAPRPSPAKSFTVHIPRNALKIAGIAFGVGILLFVLVWLTGRDKEFFRADPAAQTPQETAQVEPLPEPLAAAAGSSDMPDAKPAPVPDEEDAPKLVETAPPPPPATVEPAPAAPGASAPATANAQPMPIAGQSPPPAYPAAALRRGEAGSVVVRVEVDATGYPNNVTVIQRSGSRELDRAATDAVRRWRFSPAVSNGQPVPGSIEVPFDFKPQ